jgi:hypothetical protein
MVQWNVVRKYRTLMQVRTKLSQINGHFNPALKYALLMKPARKCLVREKSRPKQFKG